MALPADAVAVGGDIVARTETVGGQVEAAGARAGELRDFPTQPSQKDGLGRMCKPHWNQYTTALRKAATTAKAGIA